MVELFRRTACAALLLVACGACDASGPRVVGQARVVEDPGIRWHATTAERFGLQSTAEAFRGSAPAPSSLTWTAPAGWRDGGARPMREVTFELGEGAECYVTILPGQAGGALANVNRWRGQMGAAPLSSEAFEATARIPVLGAERALIEVDGSYKGMGDEHIAAARLFGVVCSLGQQTVFVKLIGPRETVEAAREAFVAFCGSLKQAHG